MLNRSNRFKYKVAKFASDVPTPKRGQVLIIPEDNRLMGFAPYLAGSKLPHWWPDLKKDRDSLRRCIGTYDYVSVGLILPMWTDVHIRPDSSGMRFEARAATFGDEYQFEINSFSPESCNGCPMTDRRPLKQSQFPKLNSPWRIQTAKGVSTLVVPLVHDPNPNYEVMAGLVHTDSYTQIHIVLNVLTNKEFTIEAGTPMQQMIPFKRSENFKNIIFGNESMFRFKAHSGLGKNGLIQEDRNFFYRRNTREIDAEIESNEQ